MKRPQATLEAVFLYGLLLVPKEERFGDHAGVWRVDRTRTIKLPDGWEFEDDGGQLRKLSFTKYRVAGVTEKGAVVALLEPSEENLPLFSTHYAVGLAPITSSLENWRAMFALLATAPYIEIMLDPDFGMPYGDPRCQTADGAEYTLWDVTVRALTPGEVAERLIEEDLPQTLLTKGVTP